MDYELDRLDSEIRHYIYQTFIISTLPPMGTIGNFLTVHNWVLYFGR